MCECQGHLLASRAGAPPQCCGDASLRRFDARHAVVVVVVVVLVLVVVVAAVVAVVVTCSMVCTCDTAAGAGVHAAKLPDRRLRQG